MLCVCMLLCYYTVYIAIFNGIRHVFILFMCVRWINNESVAQSQLESSEHQLEYSKFIVLLNLYYYANGNPTEQYIFFSIMGNYLFQYKIRDNAKMFLFPTDRSVGRKFRFYFVDFKNCAESQKNCKDLVKAYLKLSENAFELCIRKYV